MAEPFAIPGNPPCPGHPICPPPPRALMLPRAGRGIVAGTGQAAEPPGSPWQAADTAEQPPHTCNSTNKSQRMHLAPLRLPQNAYLANFQEIQRSSRVWSRILGPRPRENIFLRVLEPQSGGARTHPKRSLTHSASVPSSVWAA